jgi:hypothetical protein
MEGDGIAVLDRLVRKAVDLHVGHTCLHMWIQKQTVKYQLFFPIKFIHLSLQLGNIKFVDLSE